MHNLSAPTGRLNTNGLCALFAFHLSYFSVFPFFSSQELTWFLSVSTDCICLTTKRIDLLLRNYCGILKVYSGVAGWWHVRSRALNCFYTSSMGRSSVSFVTLNIGNAFKAIKGRSYTKYSLHPQRYLFFKQIIIKKLTGF